jgi:UDPglucose 6-dehydrogenase
MKNIAVVGSGVVGGATGKGLISKGHEITFYDIKREVLDSLNNQGHNAKHVDSLDANNHDAFFLLVPTPTEDGEINLQHLESAVRTLAKKLKNRESYFVVVVRSTVLPGTTEDLVIPILEKESGKKAGSDFGVAMNPEYLREKNAEDDFKNPWIITVGSLDQRSTRFMAELYQGFDCPIHHLSLREAETQKYVHNLFNAVKIAFFNEMRVVCNLIDISPDRIFEITADSAEGSWNKKYGIRNFGPFDGMCLPKDTKAFSSWSKKLNIHMDVLEGAINANKKYQLLWDEIKNKEVESE